MKASDYLKTRVINGRMVNIGKDDYGQCYYFEYVNDKGQLQEVSCGTYNFNWEQEVQDYFDIMDKHSM